MAWNEPGKDKDKDPWGGRTGNDGPPDLDEAFKKFQQKLNGMFGGRSNGSGNNPNASSSLLLGIAAGVALVIYGLAGFYTVDAKERAVVLQFGAFKEIKSDGLNWNAPWFTTVIVVNVTGERQYPTHGLMLTQDESIALVQSVAAYPPN